MEARALLRTTEFRIHKDHLTIYTKEMLMQVHKEAPTPCFSAALLQEHPARALTKESPASSRKLRKHGKEGALSAGKRRKTGYRAVI